MSDSPQIEVDYVPFAFRVCIFDALYGMQLTPTFRGLTWTTYGPDELLLAKAEASKFRGAIVLERDYEELV